jgi:WD40 repeat protein
LVTDEDKERPNQKITKFNSGGDKVLTAGEDGVLRVWAISKKEGGKGSGVHVKKVRELKWNDKENSSSASSSIEDAVFAPFDDELIAAVHSDKICRVWKGSQPFSLLELPSSQSHRSRYRTRSVRFLDSEFGAGGTGGRRILTLEVLGKAPTYISIWNYANLGIAVGTEGPGKGTLIQSVKVSKETLVCFDISPNLQYLAAGTPDGEIQVFDARNPSRKVFSKKCHNFVITTVKFTSDSTGVISASADYSAAATKIKPSSGN